MTIDNPVGASGMPVRLLSVLGWKTQKGISLTTLSAEDNAVGMGAKLMSRCFFLSKKVSTYYFLHVQNR